MKMVSRLLQKAAEMYAVRQNTATPNRPIKVEVDILQSMLQVVEASQKNTRLRPKALRFCIGKTGIDAGVVPVVPTEKF